MIEQPPRVVHARHPVVTALDEGRFLDRMVEVLGPGEWIVPTESGFWWSPWRTRHEVEMVTGADGMRLCRSTFLLVADVHHEVQALNMANYVNQVSVGGVCWYDAQEKSLKVTSMATVEPGMWAAAFIFEQMVQRMVGVMERIAPWLALECEGVVPEPQHPSLGLRSEPDQLVREWAWSTEVPEAACGLWWSQREVEGFRRAARFMVAGEYGDSVGAQVDPLEWHDEGTGADNLGLAFVVERGGHWARLALQEGRHPDFGFGPELHLTVSEVFGTEDEAADQSVASVPALDAANRLNWFAVSVADCQLLLGGWNQHRGQLSHTTFIYPEVAASLQSVALPSGGEALGVLFGVAAKPLQHFWYAMRDQGLLDIPHHRVDELRWNGTAQNAPLFPLLDGHEELWERLVNTLPVNQLVPMFTLDDEPVAPQTQMTVFDFGIFNPVGPTVGSMEVAVNYQLQRALLITRFRHPFSPSVRVHALLDFDGFQNIAPLVQHVVATLDWSGPEWLRVRHPNPEVHEAVFDGLRVFARMRSDRDWGEKATQLVDAAHDPWQRLDSRFEAQSSVPEGIDPIDYWVAVVTNPRVIDGHVAMVRSVWEGAQAFVRNDDPEDAQRVSQFLRRQVYQRADPDRSGVTPEG